MAKTSIKFPESIKIGDRRFRVSSIEISTQNGSDRLGWCDSNSQEIAIPGGRKKQMAVETLVHELFHASLHFADITLKNEEHVISALSPIFCMIAADNPELVEWLIAKEPE